MCEKSILLKSNHTLELFGNMNSNLEENYLETWIIIGLLVISLT